MKNGNNDISSLEEQMANNEDICCSCGIVTAFPKAFFDNYRVAGVGIMVCTSGSFTLRCEGVEYAVTQGETVFLARDVYFSVSDHSADCGVVIILYRVDSIRDFLGTTIVGMKFVEMLNPRNCWVMHTQHESEFEKYAQLLAAKRNEGNVFAVNEHKLLLLALTYRVCSIFGALAKDGDHLSSRKLETYMRLMQLIDQYYVKERGVRFYADKLCLSPKYLTSIVKSVSGSSVQQLVFKAITKKAIFLVNNTDKSIKEISDYLNFPNASAFGTFFKKQVGMSPVNYRQENLRS